jgi:hypothetical protein
MSSVTLLGQYRTALNHISLTYASLVLWSCPDTPEYFDALYERLDGIPRPFPQVVALLRDPQSMRIACEELYESAHRSAITNLFPLTRRHLRSVGKLEEAKREPWFQLFFILRNYFAHDMTFHFNDYERSLLPLTWSGVTIQASMNECQLTNGQFSREKLRELLEAAHVYIASNAA